MDFCSADVWWKTRREGSVWGTKSGHGIDDYHLVNTFSTYKLQAWLTIELLDYVDLVLLLCHISSCSVLFIRAWPILDFSGQSLRLECKLGSFPLKRTVFGSMQHSSTVLTDMKNDLLYITRARLPVWKRVHGLISSFRTQIIYIQCFVHIPKKMCLI